MWPCRRARGSSCNNETTPFVTEALPPLLINVQPYRSRRAWPSSSSCMQRAPRIDLLLLAPSLLQRIVISRATASFSLSLSLFPSTPFTSSFPSRTGNAPIYISLSLSVFLLLALSSFLSPFHTFARLVCPLAVPKERAKRGGSRRRRQHTIGIHRAHVPRTFTCRHNAAPNRSRGIVIQIVAYSTTIHKHCR